MATDLAFDPRFPVGDFHKPASISADDRLAAIATLRELPVKLREAVAGLDDAQLDTPYREGGWTVRQLVHHVADSHMTAFHRMRKALTEDWPAAAGYDEARFAELPDSALPIDASLAILEGLHTRWVAMLQGLSEEQWQRGITHSQNGPQSLDLLALLYQWHSLHHTAHVTNLRRTKGW
ncbi:DinB superfamily protein [Bryocella elongata]|uniref:DinB superfamily protein n=1 Tax=Bryocella elongata TaxID=863522 RepID=A0A1H6AHP2_9BACT|nr:putative metal-dependent hydrolase [Bryocella elongata]SEG48273.1 DinB superfamily protein [Bryocella elongata]